MIIDLGRKRHGRISPLEIATIMTVFLIWGQSLIPGDLSSEESGFVMKVIMPIWEGLGAEKVIALSDHFVRKAFGHFLEYSVLGAELGALIRLGNWNPAFLLPLLGVVVACVDETIQIFTPNRGPAVGDVLLDCCGVFIGAAVSLLIRIVLRELKARGKPN